MWTFDIDVVVKSEDGDLPDDEMHPFWMAMDPLVDVLSDAGVRVRSLSDAPAWALNYWCESETAPPAGTMARAFQLLSEAKLALPLAIWTVKIDGKLVPFD